MRLARPLLHVCRRIAKTLLKGFRTGASAGKLHWRSPSRGLCLSFAVFGEPLSQDLLCLELLLALLGGGYFGQVALGRRDLLVHLVRTVRLERRKLSSVRCYVDRGSALRCCTTSLPALSARLPRILNGDPSWVKAIVLAKNLLLAYLDSLCFRDELSLFLGSPLCSVVGFQRLAGFAVPCRTNRTFV